jgi:hypothetical protein
MQESKLFGTLLPSSPDFLPIVQAMRAKCKLPEISPDDDPIEEIFLYGERVRLEDFRQEIKSLVQESEDYLPPELFKMVTQARHYTGKPLEMGEIESCPGHIKQPFVKVYMIAEKRQHPSPKPSERCIVYPCSIAATPCARPTLVPKAPSIKDKIISNRRRPQGNESALHSPCRVGTISFGGLSPCLSSYESPNVSSISQPVVLSRSEGGLRVAPLKGSARSVL